MRDVRKPEGMTQLEILTVQDVADRLRISKSSVYELTRFRSSMRGPRLPARNVATRPRVEATSSISARIVACIYFEKVGWKIKKGDPLKIGGRRPRTKRHRWRPCMWQPG
jgi:hypothetical protein